jgi:hypothetical protein
VELLIVNTTKSIIIKQLLTIADSIPRGFSLFLQLCFFFLSLYIIGFILKKQNNIIDKILLNFLFLILGTIIVLTELYLLINVNNEPIYLRQPIAFSLLFISALIIFMLYNMYFIWKDINKLRYKRSVYGKVVYRNRFGLFIFSILFIILIVIFTYGFMYYIINNLPLNVALDLEGNFLDDGVERKFGECVYFSSVTFFSVGYGDIVPKGLFFCSIVILEMITSYLIGIVSIPILLSILNESARINTNS